MNLLGSVELVMDQTGCVGYLDGGSTEWSLLYEEICSQLNLKIPAQHNSFHSIVNNALSVSRVVVSMRRLSV